MTNTKVLRRVLLTALPAAVFGAIALALALLTPPPHAASQAAEPEVQLTNRDIRQAEGTTIDIEVRLTDTSTPATQDINVMVGISGGITGTETLTIATGTTATTVTITLPSDDVAGTVPLSVFVLLLEGSGYTRPPIGPGQFFTIVIEDDDVAVGFGQATYTATEGSQVTVPVELKGNVNPAAPVMVTVEISGEADQTLTLTDTNRSDDITFTAPDDDDARATPADVVLALKVTSPQGFDVATGFGTATVQITDNDPVAEVGFSNPSHTVTEGETAMLSVELPPNVTATRAVSVTVSDGEGFSQDVTIQNGQREASFSYTAPNDERAAPPAARTLQLSDPVNGSVASGSDSAMVSFTDDGDPVATFRLVTGTVNTVVEGSEATLMVETVNGVPVTLTTRVRVAFKAEFGDDPADAEAVFSDGDNSAMLTVRTPDNGRAGRPTALTASLVSSDNGEITSAAAQAGVTLTLLDDGKDLAVPVFAPRSDQRVLQGSRVKFVARLQGGVTATEAVDVQLTFSDGRAPQTVQIPAGQSEVEFEVRTTTSGPTPPPLQLMLASSGGGVAAADAASATLVQTPPLVDAASPAAGGVALGWGALITLLALALLALSSAAALLTRRPR